MSCSPKPRSRHGSHGGMETNLKQLIRTVVTSCVPENCDNRITEGQYRHRVLPAWCSAESRYCKRRFRPYQRLPIELFLPQYHLSSPSLSLGSRYALPSATAGRGREIISELLASSCVLYSEVTLNSTFMRLLLGSKCVCGLEEEHHDLETLPPTVLVL